MSRAFDWAEYLKLAEAISTPAELAASVSSEARARCAISRAYYAVAMTARDLLRAQGVSFSTSKSVHHEIALRLSVSPAVKHRRVADHLTVLRKHRNLSDYNEHFSATAVTRDMLDRAEESLKLLTEH